MGLRSLLTRILLPLATNPSRAHLERWLREAASTVQRGRVLDAGAGSGPYRHLFDHLDYEAADHHPGDHITHVCDLSAIPVEDARFDLLVSSQVLEHVPDPVAVLREFRRVTRPGAQIWLSAPLFFEEHEQPHDFYRYTQYAWHHMAAEAGLAVHRIEWLEGYYGTLGYQLGTASRAVTFLPARVVFAWSSVWFSRRDLTHKHTDRGMPKNYAVVMAR